MSNRFWIWNNDGEERILYLNGAIAEESWFDDDVTPQIFKDELNSGGGDITLWINSPGGDCIAAAQIYNMLTEYKGKVTVKIDGIAASAASVIAMAGDTVLMSPVSTIMIHNPATIAAGDHTDMQKAIDMLNEVKESIINAYVIKTGMSRAKLSRLMDAETWMNASKAIKLGFADGLTTDGDKGDINASDVLFSCGTAECAFINKLKVKFAPDNKRPSAQSNERGHCINDIMQRLEAIKKFI